ncbi:hypothetical protein RND71_000773 [Anisodus tanguticus]|uniref:Uncharacterized protein n=1 Tax=Anisodus tanguticus TaxID=243964 RepID=A0AAE1VVE3_9SOLA|nr:hypothetical protein RND71_000773 [Anisodus tanguticus]
MTNHPLKTNGISGLTCFQRGEERKMRQPFFSFKFGFFFSLSLAASYTATFTPTSYSYRKLKLRSSASPPVSAAVPKASPADLLALLGPPQQASAVNSQEARQLRSCFKFLVPFSPSSENSNRRSLSSKLSNRRSISEENELIWWPPAPVMELARLAVDSGGDTASIQRTLDPTVIPVPDIEGSKEDRCELTRTPYGRLFINEVLLFSGSNVSYDDSMNLRNILWLAPLASNSTKEWLAPGVLVVLDAHPSGVIYKDLIPEYVQIARTLYEGLNLIYF